MGAIQRTDPLVRFMAKVKVSRTRFHNGTPCWEWTGYRTANGYGQFFVERIRGANRNRVMSAHQWAYTHYIGPVPEGLELDHLCRNPACCNPVHLEPVTHLVNMQRGRKANETHCPSGHPYDTENTYISPSGGRYCKECNRERARANRRRRRDMRRQQAVTR